MRDHLNSEDKTYIEKYFYTKTPEELSEFLDVDVEVIIEYISSVGTDLVKVDLDEMLQALQQVDMPKKAMGVNADEYVVQFNLNKDGNVDIHVRWPKNFTTEEFGEKIAILLEAINNGRLRLLIAEKLAVMAQKNNLEEPIGHVIRRWRELENINNQNPCISPREVFQ
jgi:hypothetical protein